MITNKYDVAALMQHGIDAAKSGNSKTAQACFRQVLVHASDHVPALLWLAFLAPTPQESLNLLERVLKLDPNNIQAKQGLDWAKKRAISAETPAVNPVETEIPYEITATEKNAAAAEVLLAVDSKPDLAAASPAAYTDSVQEIPSNKQLRTGSPQRHVRPLLAAVVTIGLIVLLGVTMWALFFGPPDTLAAWLPAASDNIKVAVTGPVPVDGQSPKPAAATNFTMLADTIIIDKPAGVKPEGAAQLMSRASNINLMAGNEFNTARLNDEGTIVEIEAAPRGPVDFIGPTDELLFGPRLFQPVDVASLPHQPTTLTEKWIEVVLSEQRVTAWEGNTPVMSFLTSTGLPNTPTVQGKYNIYWKLKSTLMAGPGYYLPEVPYTMYFYAGYGLHGAYWHDNFGQPMSHGCVNLSIDNAKTLFEWADPVIPEGQNQVTSSQDNPGTLVVVHE